MPIDNLYILTSLLASARPLIAFNETRKLVINENIEKVIGEANGIERNLFYAIRNAEGELEETLPVSLAPYGIQAKFGPEAPHLTEQERRRILIQACEFYGIHWKRPLTEMFMADEQRAALNETLVRIKEGATALDAMLPKPQPSYLGTDGSTS